MSYLCKNCGHELAEGQEFCPKCGTKKEAETVVQQKVCPNCGNSLSEEQEFCPKCGTRYTAVVDTSLNEKIQSFNSSVDSGNKKQKNKKVLTIVLVAVVVLGVLGFVFKDSIIPFKGYYTNISVGNEITYTFNGNTYDYKSSDDSYTSTFEKNGKTLTLKDDEGDTSVFYIKGNMIYDSESKYETALNSTSGYVNQTLKNTTSATYKGKDISFTQELDLDDDGSYTLKYSLYYIYSDDIDTKKGTYEISNGLLTLNQSDGKTFYNVITSDGTVYYQVYQK